MRLSELRPMALVEEQTFLHLWWDTPSHTLTARGREGRGDVQVLTSAQEVLNDWAAAAHRSGCHVAFGTRACLKFGGGGGGDCSWVAAIQQQHWGRALQIDGIQPAGEPFSFPFQQTSEPGQQRQHYPRLADLLHLTSHASPSPLALRVLALWRHPIDTLCRRAASLPNRFWRSAERGERMRMLASELIAGGQEAYEQITRLPRESVRLIDTDAALANPKVRRGEVELERKQKVEGGREARQESLGGHGLGI